MKNLFTSIVVLCFAVSASAQTDTYYTAGFSLFQENVDAVVGGGVGAKIGIGTKFNKTFGVEASFDVSEPLNPQKIIDELGYQPLSYDIKTRANRYLSVMGTASLEMGPTLSLVGKLGFTKFVRRLT